MFILFSGCIKRPIQQFEEWEITRMKRKKPAGTEKLSRRKFLKKAGAMGLGAAAMSALPFPNVLRAAEPIKIGVLHSLSGTMAISEVSLRDVVMMAVEEINSAGGVMKRPIKPVVVDPGVRLGFVRREGEAASPEGRGGRDLRLLDLGEPQIRPSRL